MSEPQGRNRWLLGVAVGVCVIVVVAVLSHGGGTKVTGDTPEERRASVIELASSRPRGYVAALTDAARNDTDPSVRNAALVCLNGIEQSDVRSVVHAATHDDDPQVRRGACRTMMTYEDEATIDRLTEIALGDPDEGVRNMAFVALAANDSPHAVVKLIDMMEHGVTEEIQLAAAVAVVDKLNMARVADPQNQEEWENMLEGMRLSPNVQAAYEQTGTPLVHDEQAQERMTKEHNQYCHGKALDKPIEQNTPREE